MLTGNHNRVAQRRVLLRAATNGARDGMIALEHERGRAPAGPGVLGPQSQRPPAAATPASAVLCRSSPAILAGWTGAAAPQGAPSPPNCANPLKKALFFARAGCTIRSSAECDSYNTYMYTEYDYEYY